jgi:hypothetical protein
MAVMPREDCRRARNSPGEPVCGSLPLGVPFC